MRRPGRQLNHKNRHTTSTARGAIISRSSAEGCVLLCSQLAGSQSIPFGWDGSDELNPYGRTCMGKSAFHDRIIYNTSSRFLCVCCCCNVPQTISTVSLGLCVSVTLSATAALNELSGAVSKLSHNDRDLFLALKPQL